MILTVSFPEEDHTRAVHDLLTAAGHEVALLDLAAFPAAPLALSYGGPPELLATTSAGLVDVSRCRVGWWRRLRPHTIDASVVAPHARAFAASETEQAVHGMLASLGCVWVNPPALDAAAHHKPLQLALAGECGLRIPRTLVTNDPARARAFIAEAGVGRVVFKAFLASSDAWRETRLAGPAEVELLETVRFAPVLFQEYVPGVDLRVTIVGDRLFTAEIDARATRHPVDMRLGLDEARVRAGELPPSVAKGLLALMSRLGLRYGAADLRRDERGEHVFLEVNPAGQWLFAEELTGLPITRAVADLLAGLDG